MSLESFIDGPKKNQLELPIVRAKEPDRNHQFGGRSFYFFDFDDNVAFLSTSIILFHKDTGKEMPVTTAEYAQFGRHVGVRGPYAEFEIRYDDEVGTFRRFRDKNITGIDKWMKKQQPFIEDLAEALGNPDFHWKGPSWSGFYHATFNQRPISVITARGHHPDTIRDGVEMFVREKHLPNQPNYLGLFPVSHPETRQLLGDFDNKLSVAKLKQRSIRASVELAFDSYGFSPHHRFGMSDDDPHNIELIIEEMTQLKREYPEISLFVIETSGNKHLKKEIFEDHVKTQVVGPEVHQLSLFESI